MEESMEDDRIAIIDRLAGSILVHRLVFARILIARLVDESQPLRIADKVRNDFMADLQRSIEGEEPGADSDALHAYGESEISELMQIVIDGLRPARG
jgi:hypothetical protein